MTPAAAIVFEGGAPWGYDAATHTLRSPRHSSPAVSPEFADTLVRYLTGVKLLLQLDMATRTPEAITIEHDRRCQLGCTFCYSGSNKVTTSPRLDPQRVFNFVSRYQTRDVHVYGGDPFYDANYMLEMLEGISMRTGGIRNLHLSTNALGLKPEVLVQLRTMCSKLDLQISCEPEFFGLRNTKGGPHQNAVLAEKLAALPDEYDLKFSTVLSPSAKICDEDFASAMTSFNELAGKHTFSVLWMMQTGTPAKRPLWLEQWVRDNWELQLTGHINQRFHRSMFGSAYARYVRNWKRDAKLSLQGNLGGCGSGTGNFTLASDGQLYSCHEKASVGDQDYRVSGMTAWDRWKASRAFFTPDYKLAACRACPAKFGCQLCSVKASDNTCWFETERFSLGLHLLYSTDLAGYNAIADELQTTFFGLLERKTQITTVVRSGHWSRLLSGTENIDTAKWCYEAVFGRPMQPLMDIDL